MNNQTSSSTTSSFQILQQACNFVAAGGGGGNSSVVGSGVGGNFIQQQPQPTQILISTEDFLKLNQHHHHQIKSTTLLPNNTTTVMMMAPITTNNTILNVIPATISGGGSNSGGTIGSSTQPAVIVEQQQQPQQSSTTTTTTIITNNNEKQKQIQIETDEDYQFELSSLENCARQSRLSSDKMSLDEMKAFEDVVENTSLIPIFLHIRNSILKFWLTSPKVQLLFENVCQRLEQPFNNDPILISRIFNFLERHGYINFGVFQITKHLLFPKPKKIAIIGGGIAGLIAARQLKYFGFNVIVLEARDRLGGRIWTYEQNLADLGSFVITGLIGNPMRILARQINLELCRINQKCPLYLNNTIVDKSKDEVLENVFNNILESTSSMVKEKNILNDEQQKPLSLGDGLDIILELLERQVRLEYLKFLNDYHSCQEALLKNFEILKALQITIKDLYEKHKEALQNKQIKNPRQEYMFRVNRYDLNRANDLFELTKRKIKKLQLKIQEFENESKNIPQEYLSPIDRRILDWHFANLEFATGSSLKNLSLQHWDLDDEYQFSGTQVFAKDGHNQVIFSLANGNSGSGGVGNTTTGGINGQDFEIHLNHCVQSIILQPNGVEIQAINLENNNNNTYSQQQKNKLQQPTIQYTVDAVLCTLPLGILKTSVNNNNNNNSTTTASSSSATTNSTNFIQFKPPLPDYKCQAINRLGFGNLNKAVLVFEKIFWDLQTDLFGNISPTTENRGELFLFTSVSKQPVLVAFIAGEAADNLEKLDDETIKNKCLEILENMFGGSDKQPLPKLKKFFITRWKSDPYSQGSYSYVAKGATGDDFDLLAQPISYFQAINNTNNINNNNTTINSQSTTTATIPRLYFAGEHTIRQYPSTVHGALLSGLREAAKIANQFLGVPYLPKN